MKAKNKAVFFVLLYMASLPLHKMLLYFYVSGGDIRNDDFAKDRFEANDTNAFGNFYETILRKDRTFRRFDLELEPINLLKVVIE